MPGFIVFDEIYRNFTIKDTGNLKAPKKYNLIVTGVTRKVVTASFSFTLLIAKDLPTSLALNKTLPDKVKSGGDETIYLVQLNAVVQCNSRTSL